MKYVTLCVLSDGTTYTNINGCKLYLVSESQYEEMLDGSNDLNDLSPIAVVDLSSLNIVPRL